MQTLLASMGWLKSGLSVCSTVSFTGLPRRPSNTHENRTWISCRSGPRVALRCPSLFQVILISEIESLCGVSVFIHPLGSDSKAFCPGCCSIDTLCLSEELGPFLLLPWTCLTLDLALTFLVSLFSSMKCKSWTSSL